MLACLYVNHPLGDEVMFYQQNQIIKLCCSIRAAPCIISHHAPREQTKQKSQPPLVFSLFISLLYI